MRCADRFASVCKYTSVVLAIQSYKDRLHDNMRTPRRAITTLSLHHARSYFMAIIIPYTFCLSTDIHMARKHRITGGRQVAVSTLTSLPDRHVADNTCRTRIFLEFGQILSHYHLAFHMRRSRRSIFHYSQEQKYKPSHPHIRIL